MKISALNSRLPYATGQTWDLIAQLMLDIDKWACGHGLITVAGTSKMWPSEHWHESDNHLIVI